MTSSSASEALPATALGALRAWSLSAYSARCVAEAHMALFGPFTPVDQANSCLVHVPTDMHHRCVSRQREKGTKSQRVDLIGRFYFL